MKKSLIASLAIATLTVFATAPTADARPYPTSHVYISGYHSSGTPIYTERYFVRYNSRGTVIWAYRSVPSHRYHHHVRRPMPPRYHHHHNYQHKRPHYRGHDHRAPVRHPNHGRGSGRR